ncbi:MAG: PAC2 family protein [Candidatus Nanoarchaeia archaeon]|nr:PAC2 family protein [Candidatus Nanoarchaeia archaeon]
MSFEFRVLKKTKVKNPILLEGLPGIGNVGKLTSDYLIDTLKAEKWVDIKTFDMPNAVFVNEENLIERPSMSIYHKKLPKNDLLILVGDVQPLDERACYEFCDSLLKFLVKYKTKEIIALGGIGLGSEPDDPRVFSASNDKKIVIRYKHKNLINELYGLVGPIVGVTGILPALASDYKIPSIILLSETLGHPGHIGIKSSRAVLQILKDQFNLKINLKEMDEEIIEVEKEVKTKDLSVVNKKQKNAEQNVDYIG